MNLVLRDFLIKMFAARRKFLKIEFLAMMEGSNLLTDPGFWRSDNEDGARNYSGKAGWPDLAKRIIRDLDEGRADTNLFATLNSGQSPIAPPSPHFSVGNRKPALKPEATMSLQIGGGSTPITRFNQIPVIIANWIFRQKGNLVIIPNFVHSANEGFPNAAQTKELENGYFIEIGDDRKRLFQKGRILLDRNDMPDVAFTVVLDDGTTASH